MVSAWTLACGGTPQPGGDAGPGDGGSIDAPLDAAADARADAGRCFAVAAESTWTMAEYDDTSVEYRARLTPDIGGDPWDLFLESRRFFDPATGGEVAHTGTFPLGAGADESYGTCAHCVIAFYGTSRDRGYLARSGTLTATQSPFDLTLDFVLDDVELVEVTIDPIDLTSTPVPGGDCLFLDHVEVTREFGPPGWTCGIEEFEDGVECDCECGILDRDCTNPALPIDGCTAGQLCRPLAVGVIGPFFGDSICANDCDRAAGVSCPGTEVCIDHAFGDLCTGNPAELDRIAGIGDLCAVDRQYCAIDASGMANGYCDLFARADRRCRPRCSVDADCDTAIHEHCYVVGSDASSGTEVPFGYCALRYPEGWTCDGGDYADGTACHCGCGVADTDCFDLSLPIVGCAAGEVCSDGTCGAPPAP
jgi:hypothetical protein